MQFTEKKLNNHSNKINSLRPIRFGLTMLLVLSLCFQIFPVSAFGVSAMQSSNILSNDYLNYNNVIESNLYFDENGYFVRVEATQNEDQKKGIQDSEKKVYIEKYDSNFKIISQKTIQKELPLFGGFYHAKDGYNYIVYGNQNLEENEQKEVLRIVRYSADMEKIDSTSVFGSNTSTPFVGGVVRMEENNGFLYIYTTHEMYTAEDGNHHQANMFYIVRLSDMKLTYSRYKTSNPDEGYVSHSFNQFLAIDKKSNSIITADHGDGYPRSVVLYRYPESAGHSELKNLERLDLVDINGRTGDNYTGLNLGGLEVTESGYLVAYSSVLQDENASNRLEKNVYVSLIPRNQFEKGKEITTQLTNYKEGSRISAGTPHLLNCQNGNYLLLWTQYKFSSNNQKEYQKTYAALLSEDGTILSGPLSINGILSDCEPILVNDQFIWYTTNPTNEEAKTSEPQFFSLSRENLSTSSSEHKHAYVLTDEKKPTCTTYGQAVYTCSICHESYNKTLAKIDHVDADLDGYCDVCKARTGPFEPKIISSKPYYSTTDQEAVFTLEAEKGISIANIEIMDSHSYRYSLEKNGTTLRLMLCDEANQPNFAEGSYDLFFILNDATIIESKLIISDTPINIEQPTEKPTVDNSTNPDISEPTTLPEPEPPLTTDFEPAPEDIIPEFSDSAISVSDSYILGLTQKTSCENFKALVLNSNFTVLDSAGNEKKDADNIATGDVFVLLSSDGENLAEYEIVVVLDVDCNGKVNSSDARSILRSAARLDQLSEIQTLAADGDHSGKVNSADARMALRIAAKLPV